MIDPEGRMAVGAEGQGGVPADSGLSSPEN